MRLRSARVLVSNDDGINAPGLKILERIAKSLSDDVWVVAPESEQSASGHSLTSPLRVRKIGARKFGVNGIPGLRPAGGSAHHFGKPLDLFFPASMPAAIWARYYLFGHSCGGHGGALLGIPAIALSQVRVYGEMFAGGVGTSWTEDIRKLRKMAAQCVNER